jgi:hypothetical protein
MLLDDRLTDIDRLQNLPERAGGRGITGIEAGAPPGTRTPNPLIKSYGALSAVLKPLIPGLYRGPPGAQTAKLCGAETIT